jgi:hypothetical protein
MSVILHKVRKCSQVLAIGRSLFWSIRSLQRIGPNLRLCIINMIVSYIPTPNWRTTNIMVKYSQTQAVFDYTGCPRRNGHNFGRVFVMLKCTDITQNTYIQSRTVTEIMAREKCGLLGRSTHCTCQLKILSMPVLKCRIILLSTKLTLHMYFLQGDFSFGHTFRLIR